MLITIFNLFSDPPTGRLFSSSFEQKSMREEPTPWLSSRPAQLSAGLLGVSFCFFFCGFGGGASLKAAKKPTNLSLGFYLIVSQPFLFFLFNCFVILLADFLCIHSCPLLVVFLLSFNSMHCKKSCTAGN